LAHDFAPEGVGVGHRRADARAELDAAATRVRALGARSGRRCSQGGAENEDSHAHAQRGHPTRRPAHPPISPSGPHPHKGLLAQSAFNSVNDLAMRVPERDCPLWLAAREDRVDGSRE
jgi:hypothetical protein